MNQLVLLFALFGASGSATRSVQADGTIPEVMARVAIGAICDACQPELWNLSDLRESSVFQGRKLSQEMQSMQLRIDGKPQAGVIAWAAAAERIGGYALDRKRKGSVEGLYRIDVRGRAVEIEVEIRNDFVRLTADAYGAFGPKGELYRVKFIGTAIHGNGNTSITATAIGWTHYGERCRLVAAIARKQVSAGVGDALAAAERGGRRLYAAGDLRSIAIKFIEEAMHGGQEEVPSRDSGRGRRRR